MQNYDYLIIGGGAMGLATAAELSKQKAKSTLVLERFSFINEQSSSGGMSRQFRLQYAQDYMAQLAVDAQENWAELQKTTTETLIDRVGSLWFGDPALDTQEGGIAAAERTMTKLGIPFEPLTATDIEAKFPFKNLPADYTGFFQKDGGIIDLKATLRALYRIADDAENVSLRAFTPVTNIESRPDGQIIVHTDGESYKTNKLILTPGPFVNDLLGYLGLSINVDIWEMSSAYYRKTGEDKYPTWFVFQEPQNTSLFYGFPEVEWSNPGYVRVAPDIPDRTITDPADRTGVPSQKSLGLNSAWVRDHMTGLDPSPDYTATCLITLSNNKKEMMIDTLPEWVHNYENILVYTGGWAAKFIPLLGEILAEKATTGKCKYPPAVMDNFRIEWPAIRGEVSRKFILSEAKDLELDVAIVGGGASGLYSAYRLQNGVDKDKKGLDLNTGIFEMSDRIGGRLMSVRLPGMSVVGELGGMRYMTSQQIVTGLIEKVFAERYSLKNIDFPMGDANHHLMYLRGQRFFANRFNQASITGEAFSTRYAVNAKYVGKSADDIFTEIIEEVLKADGYDLAKIQAASDPRKEWNKVKDVLRYNFPGPYEGMLVSDIGFWNLLKDRSNQECYEFLAQAGGYYSNTINWNAAEAFPYMVGDFANDETVYKTIEGGYDQILTCLADMYMQNGGTIYSRKRLKTFQKNPDAASPYRYLLTFYDEEAKEDWVVKAKDIILGMPKRSLELLDQNNFFFDRDAHPEMQHNLESVIPEPSYKLLLGFETPWWKETLGAQAGESITDLPMRQCYYFGTDPENSHSLFLASYNDMRTANFWHALEGGERYPSRETALVKKDAAQYAAFDQASKTMVEEVLSQIRELHGHSITIPDPYISAYKDWTHDPYGGGYHAWKNAYKIKDVMPYIRQPDSEERIFIVGEAYSDQQGWVEGAFCVTEHVMREKYGLVCPGWLDEDYFLGY